MNVVLIMTDTQNRSMSHTPGLEALAAQGMRFNNAYTACPVCTPARGALFSGLHPQSNGAICNNVAPGANIPLMGTVFREHGYRAAYTGKWHLDGTAYFGDGVPGGGFEEDWWYDGKRYAEDIGPEMFEVYRTATTAQQLRDHGFTRENTWGHRVAQRAVDFLERVGDAPFLLVCSFDEPHAPFVAPPEFWEQVRPQDIPRPGNYNAPVAGKPELVQVQRRENGDVSWEDYCRLPEVLHWFACNRWIDQEIDRVVQAVRRLHGDDTVIVYTSDHGDQHGAHGLRSKGPMMYQETTNVPLIISLPPDHPAPRGVVNNNTVSLVDLMPTFLDLAGLEVPPSLHGTSLLPTLDDPDKPVRDAALISFHRFAVNHDSYGAYYPIRCVTDGRRKLVINLLDRDEYYDLTTDPQELHNRIDDDTCRGDREYLHEWLLEEMDRIRDPLRSWAWANRPWRVVGTASVRAPFYHDGPRRPKPRGFSFEPVALEA